MHVIDAVTDYVRRRSRDIGFDYPVAYFAIAAIAQVVSFGVAASQRLLGGASWIAALAAAIWAIQLIDYWPQGFVRIMWHAATQIGATVVLLSHPVEKDLAPTILIVITVMISASASLAASIVVAIAALITLAVPTAAGTLDWGIPYMAGLVWAIGGRTDDVDAAAAPVARARCARSPASIPLTCFIRRSMTTMSGFSWATAAGTSEPSEHSPTTLNPFLG